MIQIAFPSLLARIKSSVPTAGEIWKGLADLPQGKRGTRLETWFAGRIPPD